MRDRHGRRPPCAHGFGFVHRHGSACLDAIGATLPATSRGSRWQWGKVGGVWAFWVDTPAGRVHVLGLSYRDAGELAAAMWAFSQGHRHGVKRRT